MTCDHQLSAYDYNLPPEQIAQSPVTPRDAARLLVVRSETVDHTLFRALPALLRPGDLLVLNNTRVLPARLCGYKPSGLPVEVLLLEPQTNGSTTGEMSDRWLALVKPGRRLKPGTTISFDHPRGQSASDVRVTARVLATDAATSGRILQFELAAGYSFQSWLEQVGQVPLPPYITASTSTPEQYQTVYASRAGAVAAPTAGLHFTPDLFQELKSHGIEQAYVTLHVGVGTFRPIEVEDVTHHAMHAEWAEVPLETVEQIRQTKAKGGRVIAVGTTTVRALEGAAQSGLLKPLYGKIDLFIYPGYQWRVVDGLITNFHLPKSSLLLLVSAMMGRQRLLEVYDLAIAEGYRFYSFGDAMIVLPEGAISG